MRDAIRARLQVESEAVEYVADLLGALRDAYTFLEGNYDGDARELASRIATLLSEGEG